MPAKEKDTKGNYQKGYEAVSFTADQSATETPSLRVCPCEKKASTLESLLEEKSEFSMSQVMGGM